MIMELVDYEEETLKERVKEFIALCRYIPENAIDNISVITKKSSDTILSRNKPSDMTEILEWFEEMTQKITNSSDKLDSVTNDPKNCKLSQNIVFILRQCVITHRWVEAAQLLHPLSEESHTTVPAVWKLSMEIMMKNPKIYQDIVDKLVRRLVSIKCHMDRHEIVLDYLLFLLSQGKFHDIQNLPEVRKEARGTTTERMEEVSLLFSAYSGLVWYKEWLELKEEFHRRPDESLDILSSSFINTGQQSNIRLKMVNIVGILGNCWDSLVDKTGVWDIFIYKLVEVYEEHERIQEAEEMLLKYQEKNKENISISLQLHSLYSRNQFPKTYIIQSLKNLVRLDPSSHKVFSLYEYLIAEDHCEIDYLTSLLFKMMDYTIYLDNQEAWTTFTSHIAVVFISYKGNIDHLKMEWKSRDDVWSGLHFNINSVDPRWTSPEVLAQKLLCVAVLKSMEDPFVMAARNHVLPHKWDNITKTVQLCHKNNT